jgi:hypothetical protein
MCVYIYIYIYIAFYLLLKYCTDGPLVIANYRNMKLILNKGSRVPDSKRYVFTQCTNTTGSTPFSHSVFNVLTILIGRGYMKEWWPHIKRIIYTFLKLHLPDCIQPKQSLAPPPPPNTFHSHQLLGTTHRFSAAATKLLHLFSWQHTPTKHCSVTSVIFSKSLKYFCHFLPTTGR